MQVLGGGRRVRQDGGTATGAWALRVAVLGLVAGLASACGGTSTAQSTALPLSSGTADPSASPSASRPHHPAGATGSASLPSASDPGSGTYQGKVLAVGDSVMLGAKPCLQQDGVTVNAKGSRQISATILLLQQRPFLPKRLVIHMGTNGGMSPKDINKVMKIAGPERIVTWVTVQLPNDYSRYTYENRTNDNIKAAPSRWPNARVADWNALSGRHKAYFWGDGFHVDPLGCKAYARLVNKVARA